MSETQNQGQPSEAPAQPTTPPVPVVDTAAINSLNSNIQELVRLAAQRPPPSPRAPEPEPEVDPALLESMPRQQFVEHIVGQVLKGVRTQIAEPLNQRINQLGAQGVQHSLASEVERLGGTRQADGSYSGGKYKDFWDWRDEILSVAKQTPNATVERLYHIARAENPKKTEDLAKKYSPPKDEGEGNRTTDGETRKIRLRGFGGLTPGQSGTGARGRKMAGPEAANAAWSEAVAALGGEPLFDEE